jgi:hypothetical protein
MQRGQAALVVGIDVARILLTPPPGYASFQPRRPALAWRAATIHGRTSSGQALPVAGRPIETQGAAPRGGLWARAADLPPRVPGRALGAGPAAIGVGKALPEPGVIEIALTATRSVAGLNGDTYPALFVQVLIDAANGISAGLRGSRSGSCGSPRNGHGGDHPGGLAEALPPGGTVDLAGRALPNTLPPPGGADTPLRVPDGAFGTGLAAVGLRDAFFDGLVVEISGGAAFPGRAGRRLGLALLKARIPGLARGTGNRRLKGSARP